MDKNIYGDKQIMAKYIFWEGNQKVKYSMVIQDNLLWHNVLSSLKWHNSSVHEFSLQFRTIIDCLDIQIYDIIEQTIVISRFYM